MKPFLIFILFAGMANRSQAQVDVTNKGLLYLGGNVHLNGNFLNDTSAQFLNHAIVSLKGNLTNHQEIFSSSTGNLLLKGNQRQLIRGSRAFETFNLEVNNNNGALLQNNIIIRHNALINTGILDSDTFRISIGNTITSSNALDVSKGKLELNGSQLQNIPAHTFFKNRVATLVINNDIKFNGADTISRSIVFEGSGHNFITGDHLILQSDSTGTATVGDITGGGIYSGNSISGQITIERFINSRKAWRLLSAPVSSSNAPTINSSWQEGSTSGNPVPGYGVHITGGNSANGFDASATNLPSIKVHDNNSGTFMGLPPVPGTHIPVGTYNGYFLYVRGNRSINLMQGSNAAVTSTTLRIKGGLKTGDQVVNVNPAGYTVVGNPYPSAVNFKTLIRNNVRNAFYVWDPALSGAYGLGAYVTFIWNNSSGEYDMTSAASPVSHYIPSGEAIIVQSSDGLHPGSITFRETDKTNSGSDNVFGRSNGLDQKIRVDLYSNTDNSLLDGVLNTFDLDILNSVDENDALKLQGSGENISIDRDGQLLSIERRAEAIFSDTIPYEFQRMRSQEYRLKIETNHLNIPGLQPVLFDSYTQANTLLDPDGITEKVFQVNSDQASFKNRFKIIFNRITALPVSFTSINAIRNGDNVDVKWSTGNEQDIAFYNIERSNDGTNFSVKGTEQPKPGSANNYNWLDIDPLHSESFYRIRSISADGTYQYSNIAKVSGISVDHSIEVSPNPVSGDKVFLLMNNVPKGNYQVRILNNLGQLVYWKFIYYNGYTKSISMDAEISGGIYTLQLTGTGIVLNTRLVKR